MNTVRAGITEAPILPFVYKPGGTGLVLNAGRPLCHQMTNKAMGINKAIKIIPAWFLLLWDGAKACRSGGKLISLSLLKTGQSIYASIRQWADCWYKLIA
jgi:hypothetical protein